jgi:hypothetical protein
MRVPNRPSGPEGTLDEGKKHAPEQIIASEADAELNGGTTIGQVCQKPAIIPANRAQKLPSLQIGTE